MVWEAIQADGKTRFVTLVKALVKPDRGRRRARVLWGPVLGGFVLPGPRSGMPGPTVQAGMAEIASRTPVRATPAATDETPQFASEEGEYDFFFLVVLPPAAWN